MARVGWALPTIRLAEPLPGGRSPPYARKAVIVGWASPTVRLRESLPGGRSPPHNGPLSTAP